jgi:GWxTD domain-containing protein
MKFLEHFVETPLAQMIGWTLLHSLWEGALISVVLAAVLIAVRSPRVRYGASCCAMILMLIGFGFTLVHLMPDEAQGLQNLHAFDFPRWNALSVQDASSSWNPTLSAIAPWLGPFWLGGVWLLCLWRLASWISVQRLRWRGVCCAPDHWQKEIDRFSARLRLSRPVILLESCLAEVPMVLGHFRPLILIPIGLLAGLPPEQIRAILLHELVHIRRHDYLVNVMQRLAEVLLFYHPAIWWISRVVRIERENRCDDVVVSITGDAREYAVALTALEQSRLSGREPGIAATGGHLMKRIHRLLYPAGPNGAGAAVLAAVIFFATAAVSLAAWQSDAPKKTSSATQEHVDASARSSYSKWLDEDVVYIIDDAERAAFQNLTTNPERDEFIAQFWQRRNPTPGSPQNKFKEEHYRRIAYANKRFRTESGAPGWRTDRGHMYIVYGPPDEIDDHAKGQQKAFATDGWLYHHIDGIGDNVSFTFVDRSGAGDFHLAPESAR